MITEQLITVGEDIERQNASGSNWRELTGVLRHALKKWIDSQKEF